MGKIKVTISDEDGKQEKVLWLLAPDDEVTYDVAGLLYDTYEVMDPDQEEDEREGEAE